MGIEWGRIITPGGAAADPKLKTWKKELVCDKCRRWASALTLIKPDDGWNHYRASPTMGKRFCYRCLAIDFKLRPPSSYGPSPGESRPMLIFEIAFMILGLASLSTASLLGTDPTIPASLLLASLAFLVLERWLRGALADRSRTNSRKAWEAQEAWLARRRTEQLVSIETLFGSQ